MKSTLSHIHALLLALLVPLFVGGCAGDWQESVALNDGEVEHTLVMYLLAENNLSSFIQKNARDAEEGMVGASPATRLVIYLDSYDETKLYEVRYLPYGGGEEHIRYSKVLKTYPRQTSTSPEVMKSVMEDIKTLAPSRTYGLVLSGHGTGWYPKPTADVSYDKQKVAPMSGEGSAEYYYDWWREMPETRAMGYDYTLNENERWSSTEESSYISSAEIVEGLSPIHFDYILFDACFMSSVEFLYDMRHSADYIIASPVEILDVGMPYTEIVPLLMKHTNNLGRLGDAVMNVYMRDNEFTSRKSLALTMVDCSKLEPLADVVAEIYRATESEDCLSLVESRLQYAEYEGGELPYWEGVQPLDRMRPAGFNDFEDYVTLWTDSEELKQLFQRALDDVVVWNCHTEEVYSYGYDLRGISFGADYIEYKVGGALDLCGINTYIPLRKAPITLSYYLQTAWAKKIYGIE